MKERIDLPAAERYNEGTKVVKNERRSIPQPTLLWLTWPTAAIQLPAIEAAGLKSDTTVASLFCGHEPHLL
ncbi:MAG: hypothetical protein M0Q95_19480 [Porticoccaceae bacterium]|jgi:hypothetical protein|nr:hypothetical protein [Porticoccaceae bacterium]